MFGNFWPAFWRRLADRIMEQKNEYYERTTRKSLFGHRRQPRDRPRDCASNGKRGSGRGIHVPEFKGTSGRTSVVAKRKFGAVQSVSSECGMRRRNASSGETGGQRFRS